MNGAFKLRPIAPHEIAEAYALEAVCYSPSTAATLEAMRHRQAAYPDFFWSAWIGSRLAGFANGVLTNREDCGGDEIKGAHEAAEQGRNLCVLSVVSAPDLRGRGIGGALAVRLTASAREAGLQAVILMCERGLIPFYERLGYVHLGASASGHGGVDWQEMRCDLNGAIDN